MRAPVGLVWIRIIVEPGGRLHEGLQPGHQLVRLARRHPGKGPSEQVQAQHLAVPAQRVVPGRGQPDQRAPPVGRIALALEQPLVLQVADDLADDRLGPVQVRGRLADCQRPGHGQVLKHRPGRALELAARSVAAVKGQVHRPESDGEPLGPLLVVAHPTRVPPAHCIVNPDGFPRRSPYRCGRIRVGCAQHPPVPPGTDSAWLTVPADRRVVLRLAGQVA